MNDSEADLAEIIKAFSMLKTPVEETTEYRLHYDELGNIIMTSMRSHPESEQYLVVDEDDFKNYYRYRVVNKKLQLIPQECGMVTGLKKSNSGFCVVKNHAGVLVENDEEVSLTEYYDYRTN